MIEFQESNFKLLLNTLNEGVCYLNAQGELLYHNQTALAHWNVADPSHLHGLALQSSVAPALAGEHVTHQLVHINNHHTLLVNALPLFTETQALSSVIVISQDVSEHAWLEQQAETALHILTETIVDIQPLDDLNETLRRMAALISQMQSVDTSLAFRLDDTTGKLIPLAFYGSSEESYAERYAELTAAQHSAENAIQRPSPAYLQAIRLARTFMVDFTLSHEHSNPHNLLAAIYAPVLINGRVVGLLGAERHRPLERAVSYFPQWSVDLLTAMARLATMSIEKAGLLSSVEHLQQEAEATQKQLQQQEEFLSRIAHDLKNPLTTILGQAQVLHRRLAKILDVEANDAQQTHELLSALRSIAQQVRRIEQLINTLVEVNRIDLNRLELYLQDVDLLHLVRQTIKEHLPLTLNHEIRLWLDGETVPLVVDEATEVSSVVVQGDETRLEQIVIHLLNNAIKYSPEGGLITVSLWHRDEGVELSVADRGIGIPMQEQAHLTERAYRGENAVKSKTQGLGLGLYLVHAFVARHGGRLSIQSEGVPGKGSTFSITLPYRQAHTLLEESKE